VIRIVLAKAQFRKQMVQIRHRDMNARDLGAASSLFFPCQTGVLYAHAGCARQIPSAARPQCARALRIIRRVGRVVHVTVPACRRSVGGWLERGQLVDDVTSECRFVVLRIVNPSTPEVTAHARSFRVLRSRFQLRTAHLKLWRRVRSDISRHRDISGELLDAMSSRRTRRHNLQDGGPELHRERSTRKERRVGCDLRRGRIGRFSKPQNRIHGYIVDKVDHAQATTDRTSARGQRDVGLRGRRAGLCAGARAHCGALLKEFAGTTA